MQGISEKLEIKQVFFLMKQTMWKLNGKKISNAHLLIHTYYYIWPPSHSQAIAGQLWIIKNIVLFHRITSENAT